MSRTGTLLGALAVLLVAAACSSAPAAPEGVQDRKNRAADYLKFGDGAFREAQFDQALNFYLIALDLDTAVDHVPGMAAAWNSVANAQTALGKTEDAAAALVQAEALAALSGDRSLVLKVAVNRIQADREAGRRDQAREKLTALQPFPATAEGAALDHAQGTLERDEGNLDLALAAFDRAAGRNAALKLKTEEAANRFMKAAVLAKLDRWAEAKTELTAALALDKLMENTLGIGQDWRALGTVALKLGRPEEAFDAYVRAVRVFQSAGLPVQQRSALTALIAVAETLARPEETARYRAALAKLGPPAP